jgi:hypothetical protein
MGRIGRIGIVLVLVSVLAAAQQNPNAPANFVSVNAPVVALTSSPTSSPMSARPGARATSHCVT